MRLCTVCGEREPVVVLTLVREGDVEHLHLCAPCAAERGLDELLSRSVPPAREEREPEPDDGSA